MLRHVLLAALVLAGCSSRESLTWQAPPGDVPASHPTHAGEVLPRKLTVVFAPVATGPLEQVWPGCGTAFAFDLADRVASHGRKADADGFAAETLPASDDPAWSAGPVAAVHGADFVVLTTLTGQQRRDGATSSLGTLVTATATAELRVFGRDGSLVFQRPARGDWEGHASPKFNGPSSLPESRVAWEACANAADALLEWLEHRNQVADGLPPPIQAGDGLVSLAVASDPAGADVLIDGAFRGNTPCTLVLPRRRTVLRIERNGHVPWQRELVPDPAITVHPVLDPLPETKQP